MSKRKRYREKKEREIEREKGREGRGVRLNNSYSLISLLSIVPMLTQAPPQGMDTSSHIVYS